MANSAPSTTSWIHKWVFNFYRNYLMLATFNWICSSNEWTAAANNPKSTHTKNCKYQNIMHVTKSSQILDHWINANGQLISRVFLIRIYTCVKLFISAKPVDNLRLNKIAAVCSVESGTWSSAQVETKPNFLCIVDKVRFGGKNHYTPEHEKYLNQRVRNAKC